MPAHNGWWERTKQRQWGSTSPSLQRFLQTRVWWQEQTEPRSGEPCARTAVHAAAGKQVAVITVPQLARCWRDAIAQGTVECCKQHLQQPHRKVLLTQPQAITQHSTAPIRDKPTPHSQLCRPSRHTPTSPQQLTNPEPLAQTTTFRKTFCEKHQ